MGTLFMRHENQHCYLKISRQRSAQPDENKRTKFIFRRVPIERLNTKIEWQPGRDLDSIF